MEERAKMTKGECKESGRSGKQGVLERGYNNNSE